MSVLKGTANPASQSLFPTNTENEKNTVIVTRNYRQKRGLYDKNKNCMPCPKTVSIFR